MFTIFGNFRRGNLFAVMFTPQKLWPLTPRSEPAQKNGSVSLPASGTNPNPRSEIKGKAVAFVGAMDQDTLTDKLQKLENEVSIGLLCCILIVLFFFFIIAFFLNGVITFFLLWYHFT